MRICHIITGLNVGGAERAMHTLLSGGLAASHECHVISLSDAGYYGSLISELGVPVHCLGMSSGRPGLRAVIRLWSLMQQIKPDILQGWMYHGNLAATVGCLMLARRPVVAWNVRQSLYDLATEKPMTRVVIRASSWMSRGVSAILYNSRVARGHHENLGFDSRHARVIANGFDLEIWRPDHEARASLRESLGLAETTPLLGYVGRFDPLKDVPNLLTALQVVMAADPRLHVALVGLGLGPTNPILAQYLRELPPDRVHMLGQRPDMPKVFPAFDLLCLCSRSEGFPNVVGEAMASGVPVVVTDVGDNAGVVGDTGWIVPASDSPALANVILKALSEEASERVTRGEQARRRIMERFSLRAALDQYNLLYLELGSKN